LFETNRVLAVKLNQPISELYRLPFYEYLAYVDFLVKEGGASIQERIEISPGLDRQ
jgi:hypothetical protein